MAQFYGVAGLVGGPEWWGLAILLILAVIGIAAGRTGRNKLAIVAILTMLLALGVVVMVASIPTAQFLVLGYLGAALTLVGLAVWVTLTWAVGELALAAAALAGVIKTDADLRPIVNWARLPAILVLAGLSLQLVAVGLGQIESNAPTLAGWPAVLATDRASEAVARVAPRGTFRLQMVGPQNAFTFAVETGVAYQLTTRGLDPRPSSAVGYPTFGPPPPDGPTVVVVLPGPGRSVRAHIR